MKELKIAEQEWKEAEATLQKVQGDHGDVQRRISDISSQINAARNEPRVSPVTVAAQKFLSGQYNAPDDVNFLFTEKEDLIIKRRVLEEAVRIQRQIAEDARSKYARLLGKSRQEEYAVLVRENVKAVIALAKAVERERDFRDEFRLSGLSFNVALGNPCNVLNFGTLEETWSYTNIFLKEALKRDFVTATELDEMKASI